MKSKIKMKQINYNISFPLIWLAGKYDIEVF